MGDTGVYVDNSVEIVDNRIKSDRKYDIFGIYRQKTIYAIVLAK